MYCEVLCEEIAKVQDMIGKAEEVIEKVLRSFVEQVVKDGCDQIEKLLEKAGEIESLINEIRELCLAEMPDEDGVEEDGLHSYIARFLGSITSVRFLASDVACAMRELDESHLATAEQFAEQLSSKALKRKC